jgi:hypothetical protein
MNSSPTEITTTQSGTSDITISEGMTNYSDSIYSSMSPSMFSTYLDTVTILSITASWELPSTALSSTNTIISAINHLFLNKAIASIS